MRRKILLCLNFLILAALILTACNEITGKVIVPIEATSCDGDNVCEVRYNLSIGTQNRYLTISTEDDVLSNTIFSARKLRIKANPLVLEAGEGYPITINNMLQINNRLRVNGSSDLRYLQAESGRFEQRLQSNNIQTNTLSISSLAYPYAPNTSRKYFACLDRFGKILRSVSPCDEI